MCVPQVNGQLRQPALHLNPLLVPRNETVNRESVSQIMDARLAAFAAGTMDSSLLPDSSEDVLEGVPVDGLSSTPREERRTAILRVANFLTAHEVAEGRLRQLWSQGHEARFEEFGLANRYQRLGKVQVRQGQSERFPKAQAGSIEKEQHHADHERIEAATMFLIREGAGNQLVQLFSCVDVRNKGLWPLGDCDGQVSCFR